MWCWLGRGAPRHSWCAVCMQQHIQWRACSGVYATCVPCVMYVTCMPRVLCILRLMLWHMLCVCCVYTAGARVADGLVVAGSHRHAQLDTRMRARTYVRTHVHARRYARMHAARVHTNTQHACHPHSHMHVHTCTHVHSHSGSSCRCHALASSAGYMRLQDRR